MTSSLRADLCIIGAGSGGLAAAAGAAQMGAKTVLVERGKMGGDCLNTGCVPSKALIAAGNRAHAMTDTAPFGITPVERPAVDFRRVHDHVHEVIAGIAPHDSVERFEGLGVTVIKAHGRFTGLKTLLAGDTEITARRFIIATGSAPSVPPVPGLDRVVFFTNETIFENTEKPEHLIVIGGGPIGMELAQAHRRLGAEVSIVEAFSVLVRDDQEAAAIVRDSLQRDGVKIYETARIDSVQSSGGEGGGVRMSLTTRDGQHTLTGSHLLVAAGRTPIISDLGLENADIAHDRRAITVDSRLRTTNKRVYAIGDVCGGPQFTHVAGYQAGIVLRNALFRLPAKVDYKAVPWVTYTDPELANVGLTEHQAREEHDKLTILRWPLTDNDRARAERHEAGMVKAVVGKRGRILGASIVAPNAGDLIQPWVLAMANGLKISAMANFIAPYPTLGETSKRAAGSYYTPVLFSPRTRRLVKWLGYFG